MPKIFEIVYYLDSGTRIEYRPDDPEEISEAAMSAIIQLTDGKELGSLAAETLSD